MAKKCVGKMKVGVKIDLTDFRDKLDNARKAIEELSNAEIELLAEELDLPVLPEIEEPAKPTSKASWKNQIIEKGEK